MIDNIYEYKALNIVLETQDVFSRLAIHINGVNYNTILRELTVTSAAIKEMNTGLEIRGYNYNPGSDNVCMTLSKSLPLWEIPFSPG